jgi:hypothetical protein
MRVMVIVRASKQSESGEMPNAEVIEQMRALNEEMTKAGVLVGMGGLQPSASGKRLRVRAGKRTVIDGPFTETKELIAGYAVWDVSSMDEALRWLERFPDGGEDEDIEIRPMYDQGPCGSGYRDKPKAVAAE